MHDNETDFTNDIYLMKTVLSQICEHIELDSRELIFLELGFSDDQISKIDGVLISYGVEGAEPSIKQIAEDLSNAIGLDIHPNVVKRLLTVYKNQQILPMLSKMLSHMNEI
ncbi:hypothetical protein [Marinilactibacillus psychrotolerans]|uniref:hypothetical protein n=1 Tax=Marinilactibacillus psychrotolerans TaxID=191770 RepID=UPI0039B01794